MGTKRFELRSYRVADADALVVFHKTSLHNMFQNTMLQSHNTNFQNLMFHNAMLHDKFCMLQYCMIWCTTMQSCIIWCSMMHVFIIQSIMLHIGWQISKINFHENNTSWTIDCIIANVYYQTLSANTPVRPEFTHSLRLFVKYCFHHSKIKTILIRTTV